jgi:hypothetical protein
MSEVVAQFKQDWTKQLEPLAIAAACRQEGLTWNESALTPVVTIGLFFLQILHGNTACEHVPRLALKQAYSNTNFGGFLRAAGGRPALLAV